MSWTPRAAWKRENGYTKKEEQSLVVALGDGSFKGQPPGIAPTTKNHL